MLKLRIKFKNCYYKINRFNGYEEMQLKYYYNVFFYTKKEKFTPA